MWVLRERLAIVFVALLVGAIIYRTAQDSAPAISQPPAETAQSQSGQQSPELVTNKETAPVTRGESLPEHLFQVQARLLVGAKQFFREIGAKTGEAIDPATLKGVDGTLLSSLSSMNAAADRSIGTRTATERESRRFIARKQLILADHLGKAGTPDESNPERGADEQELDQALALGLKDPAALSVDQQQLVKARLGWFGELLLTDLNVEGEMPTILKEAHDAFVKFMIALFVFFVAILVGIVAFTIIVTAFLRGRTTWKFQPPTIPPALALETFAIYLLLMYGLSYGLTWVLGNGYGQSAIQKLGPSALLILNAGVILTTLCAVLWPTFWRSRFADLRKTFGIFIESAQMFLRDLFLAPFTYLASWVILIGVLMGYTVAIDALGIDMSQGAHPVVPLLLKAQDPSVAAAVLFLAAVVAPLVEEVFFRGALYGYMRTRLNRWFAILFSSLIFAVIHPQGAVGVVPLTCIGCVLAFLREWRGSLVAPIVAHACFNGVTILLILNFF